MNTLRRIILVASLTLALSAAPGLGLLPQHGLPAPFKPACAEDGETAPGDPAPPAEKDPGAPPAEAQPEAPPAGQQEQNEGKAPEGVRRQRPRTAEAEREYKQRKTREDPFLSSELAGTAPDLSLFYNPYDYIAPLAAGYSARYLIQDATGAVQGQLLLTVELQSVRQSQDTALVTLLYGNQPQTAVRLWLDAKTLAPQRLERRPLRNAELAPGNAAGEPGPGVVDVSSEKYARLNADYMYDRVTIRYATGPVSVRQILRQLPNSFELEALPVLVRQVDCRYADWPFEAALTDARHFRSLPLYIEEPGWTEVLSAEPELYRCREFLLRLGDGELKYYVQTTQPTKLVRFTDGVYTYTLFEYASR